MARTLAPLLTVLVFTALLSSPAEAQRSPSARSARSPGERSSRALGLTAPAPRGVHVALGSGARYAPEGVSTSGYALSFQPTDGVTAMAPGRAMHRTGTALMVIALHTQLAGAIGGVFGLIVPWGGCNDVCGGAPLNVALFSTGMVTAGLGLITFFVGLGLDIRGRIDRGLSSRVPLAMTPTGLALTF